MTKNAFYFTLKALVVLKIFSFSHDLLVMQKKRLDQKDNVNFKIHNVTIWLTNNCNTRSKGNQVMKFGPLIEYKMSKNFAEKSYIKRAGETIPRPLSKKSKLSVSLDLQFEVLNSLFLLYANLRAIEIQRNQASDHLLLPNYRAFLKNKKQKRSGTSFPALFSA